MACNYSSGKQPDGTPSIGNWNTGGAVVATGNPSKGITPVAKPGGSIADAVAGKPPVRAIPRRARKRPFKGPPHSPFRRWSSADFDHIGVKPIFGAGSPSPTRSPYNPGQLPGNDAAYDPTTGRYNENYWGAKDQSRVPTGTRPF